MNLQTFAKELKAENNFIKASFGGFAGSGKTRTATEFIIGCYQDLKIEKPLLIIDNEKGSRFLIPIFKKAGINPFLKETVYLADVLTAFDMLKSGEIGFIFIDSITKVWYEFVREYRKKNGGKAFLTLQDWGKILPAWQEGFSDKYVNLSGSCVFTGRGGYTYDMEENEETKKKEFIRSGVKMKVGGETPFEPDLNVWMELCQELEDGKLKVWREAQVLKDRSGLIDGKTFINPTYNDFKPVVAYIVSAPKGEVAKASKLESNAPVETYNNQTEAREIALEKIKNAFIKTGIGKTTEDNRLKIAIMERIFGTNSWTEIEKGKPDWLSLRFGELEQLFESWDLLPDNDSKMQFVKDFKPAKALNL